MKTGMYRTSNSIQFGYVLDVVRRLNPSSRRSNESYSCYFNSSANLC